MSFRATALSLCSKSVWLRCSAQKWPCSCRAGRSPTISPFVSARRGRRVLVQRESHIYNDSGDCAQELSGLSLVPLAPERATFTLAEVEAEVARAEEGRVSTPVGAISIESPVRRVLGEVFDFVEMQRIAAFARDKGIGLHLDGARLFLASAYTRISGILCKKGP